MQPLPREIYLDTPEYELSLDLRRRVLLDPFGIDPDHAKADDGVALHLGIVDQGRCIATLFLVAKDATKVRMRQMAVDPVLQGQGWGKKLLLYSEQVARDHGFQLVFAHARDTALPFYRALGYEEVGDSFVEVGIVHRMVQKTL